MKATGPGCKSTPSGGKPWAKPPHPKRPPPSTGRSPTPRTSRPAVAEELNLRAHPVAPTLATPPGVPRRKVVHPPGARLSPPATSIATAAAAAQSNPSTWTRRQHHNQPREAAAKDTFVASSITFHGGGNTPSVVRLQQPMATSQPTCSCSRSGDLQLPRFSMPWAPDRDSPDRLLVSIGVPPAATPG